MSARPFVVGIDVGSSMVRVIATEPPRNGAVFPRILGIGRSPSEGLRHGYVTHPDEAAGCIERAVRMTEQSMGAEIHSAYVALSGIGLESESVSAAHMISRADQEVTELDVTHVIDACEKLFISQRKNRKILHTIPLWFKLDGEETMADSPIGLRGHRLEVKATIVSCRARHFHDLTKAVTEAGVTVSGVIAAPIALSVATLSRKQRTVGCALVDIGAETVNLSVYENDALVSLEVFPIGSNAITNDLALGLTIPISQAEEIKIKRDYGNFPKRRIEDMIEARLADMFELVQNHLKKIRRDGLLPAGITFTGGGSNLSNIEDITRTSLRLPSHVLRVEQIIPGRRDLDTSWLTAYGLCMLAEESQGISIGSLGTMFTNFRQTIKSFFEQFLP